MAIRDELRHQAGGHHNHSLLWASMSPTGGGAPSAALSVALACDFSSIAAFKTRFEQAGAKHFGASWVWLVVGHHRNSACTS